MTVKSENKLIPVSCFLIHIFPTGSFKSTEQDIIAQKLFKPRKDCENFYLNSPINWEAPSHKTDRNWRMQLQGWTMFHPVMNLFDAYKDKQSALLYFFNVVESWMSVYADDNEHVVTSRMPDSYAWYDMSVGFRALIIAFFKNRINVHNLSVTHEQIALLDQLAQKHISNLTYERAFSLNNHGIFQAQGLMSLLETFPHLANEAKRNYAFNLMERLVCSQFDCNGVHMEHSPHYHFYVLSTFNAINSSGWYTASKIISDRIKKASEICKWIVDPLRRPVCIGDSILTEQNTVDFPDTCSAHIYSDFDASGYKVLRSGWATTASKASMVFLMGAYFSKTHKHRDCLSFDWFDNGGRIICDGGKYGYKSDKYRKYCLSYAAHNNIEIDGFDILKLKPYGSAILPSQKLPNGIYKLSGELKFEAIKHLRSLYVKPGEWIVVEDVLNFAKPRNVRQRFHLETDFKLISKEGNEIVARGKNGRALYIKHMTPHAEVNISFGDEDNMEGFASLEDYDIQPTLTLSFKCFVHKETLRTVFALNETAYRDALQFNPTHLNIFPSQN